jgi:phenylacetate-coenzyme A ligase PaaK-like adenylate-forming protein
MSSIEGRSDAALELPGADGRFVRVRPYEFAMVTLERGVREFQVIKQHDGVHVHVVALNGDGTEVEDRIRRLVCDRLCELGVDNYPVMVERRSQLARNAGGKLQIVIDRTA